MAENICAREEFNKQRAFFKPVPSHPCCLPEIMPVASMECQSELVSQDKKQINSALQPPDTTFRSRNQESSHPQLTRREWFKLREWYWHIYTLYERSVAQSCPSLGYSRDCRLLCLWNSLGKNTGVGSHSFLQGIFPTQGSNLCLLHSQADSLPSEPPGKPQRPLYSMICGTEEQRTELCGIRLSISILENPNTRKWGSGYTHAQDQPLVSKTTPTGSEWSVALPGGWTSWISLSDAAVENKAGGDPSGKAWVWPGAVNGGSRGRGRHRGPHGSGSAILPRSMEEHELPTTCSCLPQTTSLSWASPALGPPSPEPRLTIWN